MSTKGWAWWKVNVSTLALSLLNWTMATTAIKPGWDIIAAEDQLKPPSPSSKSYSPPKQWLYFWHYPTDLSIKYCYYPWTDVERGDNQCPGGLLLAGTDATAFIHLWLWERGPSMSRGTVCGRHRYMGWSLIPYICASSRSGDRASTDGALSMYWCWLLVAW